MPYLPPMPGWNGLHPLLIHFPIALLMVAPVFILLGAFLSPQKGRPFLITAFLLMLLGTASVFVATSTGEAAKKAATMTPQIKAVLHDHEELSESTETSFALLTVAFGAFLFVPGFIHRELSRKLSNALLVAFFLAYGAGAVLMANAAHQGGILVHQLGVHAPATQGSVALPLATEKEGR